MPDLIDSLVEDHVTLFDVLEVLERETVRIAGDGDPDNELLLSIADYISGFPERLHHPKEDLIAARLKRRHPESADEIDRLESGHLALADVTAETVRAIRQVVVGLGMTRQAFVDELTSFIAMYRAHLEAEETGFFPLARRLLAPDDWEALAARIPGGQNDPLRDGSAAAFIRLREDIAALRGAAAAR